MAYFGWVADYLDPDDYLNLLLESGTFLPTFNDPVNRARLAAAGAARRAAALPHLREA